MTRERKQRTASEWRDIYRRVEARKVQEGLSLSAILRDEGIPLGSYQNMRTRLRLQEARESITPRAAGFTKFVSGEQSESNDPIVIRHPSGCTIEVSPNNLREVLGAL
jgi:hypothetical protein